MRVGGTSRRHAVEHILGGQVEQRWPDERRFGANHCKVSIEPIRVVVSIHERFVEEEQRVRHPRRNKYS